MTRTLFATLFLLFSLALPAQEMFRPGEFSFDTRYDTVNMNGQFAIRALSDPGTSYYLIDLTVLPSRFARVYFMETSFSSANLVNVDPDLSKKRIWFKTPLNIPEPGVLAELNLFRDDAVQKANLWTPTQQAEWLQANDKYANTGAQ